MADFTLNAPGTDNNPWNPANIIIPSGTLQTSATLGIRNGAGGGAHVVFAHDVDYGDTITAEVVISQFNNFDEIFVGGVVRAGANAGACVGLVVLTIDTVQFRRYDAAGNATGIGLNITPGTNITAGDVIACTYVKSTGALSATHNGIALGAGETDSTYAAENSLAAGCYMFSGGNNTTYISSFSGTGVVPGGNAGIRITDIYQPNADLLVGDAAGVDAVVYNVIGGVELWQGTVNISSGDAVIDNDAVGTIGSAVFVVMRWEVIVDPGTEYERVDEYTYAATETVVDLDA